MKHIVLHMIGNAHIDPVWLWQWQEGFHEVKASFRSALDRMKEDAEFKFVSSSAAFYEWVEKSDPAMFEEIKARINEGRWSVTGGWWIQPDCNIPAGESFVRQALYGQRYFGDRFGVLARTGYNVDSFGHNGMLPQILRKAGLRYYVFLRPMPHEKGLPNRLFWWESDDGSRVLAFRIMFEYLSWGKEVDTHVERCARELKAPFNEGMCFYGVGNHGGGPTRENIASIHRLNADPDYPTLKFSTTDTFFESVLAQDLPIPVVHDELQHHASGCYAAHSAIKRWNRIAENRLLAAEKFAAVAARVTGQPYPGAELAQAWKDVLFNQFHDIMAGTSLESAYDDARHLHGEAIAIADRALNYAVQALAWKIDIPYEENVKPLVVFNPHTWQSSVPVEFQVRGLPKQYTLVDDRGHNIPVQEIQSWATAGGQTRLSFVADLPPLGYRTYRVVPTSTPPAGETTLRATDTTLENRRFRLIIDPTTGCIASLYDKQAGIEVFEGQAARPIVIDDPSDTWSHNVFRFQDVIGSFVPQTAKLVESGPVKAVLRVTSTYEQSTLTQDFTMYSDLDQIDVQVTVNWHEQQKMLKLRFAVNQIFMRATYEIPYGHIERENTGDEEPGQSWLDLSGVVRATGTTYGLSLLNDGKYSFDVNVRDIGLTVLRSPIYAHHIPAQPEEGRTYRYIDQGEQQFTYSLLPHTGSWETAGTVHHAAELNQKPVVLLATFHDGPLPQQNSYVFSEPDNVVVSVVKQAEDGDDLIVRAYETAKMATEAVIHLSQWKRTISASFGPCEIKTFRVPADAAQPVTETSLIELEDVEKL
jgi:alpha-mannosidase